MRTDVINIIPKFPTYMSYSFEGLTFISVYSESIDPKDA